MSKKNKNKNIKIAKDLDNIYDLYVKFRLKLKHIIKLIKYL